MPASLEGDSRLQPSAACGRERLDVLAHVVDPQDRGAALVGGDGGADARADGPVVASASPSSRPSVRLREKPITTGLPSPTRTSRRRTSSKLCCAVLPKPIPGSRQIRSSGSRRRPRKRSRSSRNAATSETTSS